MSRLSTPQNFMKSAMTVSAVGITNPQAPGWLIAIPGMSTVVGRLGITEFRRRLFHMSPALLPLALPFIPHADPWGPILVTLLFIFSITALVVAITLGPLLKRKTDENWMQAVVGYMVPVLIPFIVFPGRSELGLMTLQILALGDGSATLGGIMLGGKKLPWNRDKTYSGLFCFAIMGSLASTYSYWGESRPAVSAVTALLICGVAALSAAIVESLPIRSNDNLRVGTTALVVGLTMSAWLS